MFFYIINRLPIWKDIEENKRLVRVFFVGTFIYIIIHAILFSQYGEKNETIKVVRNYIYYMFLCDLAMTGILNKFKSNISDNDNDYSNNMGKYNLVLLNKGEFDLRIEGPDSLDIEWSIDLNGNFLTIGDSVRVFVDSNQIVNVDFRAPIVISEVKNLYSEIIPDKYFLEQNYPNPFNPSTTIRYAIPLLGGDERGGFITMKVYDVLGNEVANLINEEKPVGSYAVDFDASKLSSGIYFYRLQVYPAEGGVVKFVETRKMILTK